MVDATPSPLDHVNPYLRASDMPAGWNDMRVALSTARPGGTSPTHDVFRSPLYAWSFSKTAAQNLVFETQVPHDHVTGTALEPHVHWSPGNSTDTGVVRWQLTYSICNVGGTFGAPVVLDPVDVAASGVAYAHQLADLGSIPGASIKSSAVILCEITRVANATQDTFDAVAWGLSVDLHYLSHGFGGATEYAGAV